MILAYFSKSTKRVGQRRLSRLFRILTLTLAPAGTFPSAGRAQATAADTLSRDTAVVWTELRSNMGELRGKLPELIKARVDSARAEGRTLFVEVGATWCGPCLELERNLKTSEMIEAFQVVTIVHLDANEWDLENDLASIGVEGGVMPIFAALDTTGKAVAQLTSTIDAPGLKRFFTKHRWKNAVRSESRSGLRNGVAPASPARSGGMSIGPTAVRVLDTRAVRSLVFDQVTVVDVEHGTRRSAQRVVIAGTRITAVGPTGQVPVPNGAQVVDARGAYLIPGLWDMHMHTGVSTLRALGTPVPSAAALVITPELQYWLFLANGVTGIRDAWSPVPLDTLVRWRREILAGTRVGPPRQLLAGVAINESRRCVRRGTAWAGHTCVTSGDSADVEQLVRALKTAGADFLKTYNLGEHTYFLLANAARRVGLRFGGHAGQVSPFAAADSGASTLDHVGPEHVGALDSLCFAPTTTLDGCRSIAARFARTNTWSVPTLSSRSIRWFANASPRVIPKRLVTAVDAFWAGASFGPAWLGDYEHLPIPSPTDRRPFGSLTIAMAAGLPMLSGGDTGMEDAGFKTHADLAILVDRGLTPLAALQAATLHPAMLLGATDSLGTVAAGKLADLVLLDADPLADITNTTRIRAVVANGRYFDRAVLDSLLVEARTRAQPAPFAGPLPFDTTQAVVTEADFAQLRTFLEATVNEWNQPAMQQLMRRHLVQYPMALGKVGPGVAVPPLLRAGAAVPIPNYALIADSVPAVARALATARLTGTRYLQLSRTLNVATVTNQLTRLVAGAPLAAADTGTVVGKNVAFLRAHPAAFAQLVALGLDVVVVPPARSGPPGGQ